jgi:hypothetical protein
LIPDPPDSIRSVAGALLKLKWLEKYFFDCDMWPGHTFPFGLWFRGHWRSGLVLEPGAFRDELERVPGALRKNRKIPEIEKGTWDETNVYEHLRLRVPLHKHLYQSAFDWLCLMEHYLLPTRLLDWSESILPALFFATRKHPDIDGEIIVLNAKRLNSKSKKHPTISTPTDGHVVIRAEMATTRSLTTLRLKATVREALAEAGLLRADGSLPRNVWHSFLTPIAVFPSRLNDRMTYQASVFTVHGGKKYVPSLRRHYLGDTIPEPISISELDDDARAPLLKRYSIPSGAKKRIQDQLFKLGIHEGTLFPEVDRQRSYLKTLWWFPEK